MPTADLKIEILKVLDTLPDAALIDILKYLKQVQVKPEDTVQISRHLKLVLCNNKELLKDFAY